mgnify:CR=1 FL=1
MKKGIQKVIDKVTDKINAKYEPFIDVFNKSLQQYCAKNSIEFVPILMEEADYSTTIEFPKFKLHFTFDVGSSTGYRFMEGTLEEMTSGFVDHNNLLTRFEFDFSKLLFSPYDIHNVIRSNDFCTLDFHRISTSDDVGKCLQIILGFVDKNLIAINGLADNQQLQKELTDNYFADVVALKKKAKLNEFETDIESAMDSHETELYCQTRLENGIDKYVRTGNSKELWFSYYKYSKKNKLILFEKRYVDYLFERFLRLQQTVTTLQSEMQDLKSVFKLYFEQGGAPITSQEGDMLVYNSKQSFGYDFNAIKPVLEEVGALEKAVKLNNGFIDRLCNGLSLSEEYKQIIRDARQELTETRNIQVIKPCK